MTSPRVRAILRDTYYQFKPLLPWPLRLALRRQRAVRKRRQFAQSWPVSEPAGAPPSGWPGWPDGQRFALVLTHDVETKEGLAYCRPLLELEKELGFRSSVNFVPEGGYSVPGSLRDWITSEGFEVGIHDLKHDGKLYRSRSSFRWHAQAINQYLREWKAVGFRSAFMLHRTEWLHDLNILYDCSTFDTDPFEPQPDGVHTVFPFWVAGPEGRGYVELPYSLAQDFTLFSVLEERGPDIWKRKLDWIAERGGMALLDTHPDYVLFPGRREDPRLYPVSYYREFLEYIRTRYAGEYWQPLPREMAAYVSTFAQTKQTAKPAAPPPATVVGSNRARRRIWIDLDNTPHVPFFMPIAADLRARGYDVVLTARDAFQVCELADFHKLEYRKIGRHYGKNKLAKVAGLFFRAFQLIPFALQQKPALGLSHGSRAQMIACNLMGIPTILVADYEHAQTPPLMRPKWELAPGTIPDKTLHCRPEFIRKYSGIKEDVYAWTLTPDDSVLQELAIGVDHTVALVRPPATEAHYHNPESDVLFEHVMGLLCRRPEVRIVLLPRNRKQEQSIRSNWSAHFERGQIIVPQRALDGLNLIWHADLVISGGGTMNRESAALGVPVYSIFRGRMGAVDQHLAAEGRLILISSPADADAKILVRKRARTELPSAKPRKALHEIVAHIESIVALEEKRRRG